MSSNIMRTGSVKKTLFALGIPAMIAMVISVVYNFVDTMFIGQLNSSAAMGAVTISYPVFMTISALGTFVGVGSASYISRLLGSKNVERANQTASFAVVLGVGIALVTTVLGLIFLPQLLTLIGASETVLQEGIRYTRWLFIGSVFTILNMTLSALVRAEGNSKGSMVSLIIGAVVNIILDPIFMFTLKGGIAGAAIATVVGQICSTIYLLSYYKAGKSSLTLSLKNAFSRKEELAGITVEIVKIGIPVFLMQFLLSIATSILNTAAMPYGDDVVAAIGIANRIYTLPVYLIAGFIQGFQPFAAYNYGARLYNRLNEAIRFTSILLISSGAACTILFCSFPTFFVGMFTSDANVTALACNALTAMSFLFPFVAVILIATNVFQGMGKAKEAGIISISRQGFFFIPLALLLPTVFQNFGESLGFITGIFPTEMPYGLYGVMLTQPVSDFLATILAVIVSIKPLKELKKLEKQQVRDDE
ncbi:MAG: MATE family efflux transporter [Cellulosilyticum sp.]|nr:MATE family efflux transporter [Cellulosilyticum sp.]